MQKNRFRAMALASTVMLIKDLTDSLSRTTVTVRDTVDATNELLEQRREFKAALADENHPKHAACKEILEAAKKLPPLITSNSTGGVMASNKSRIYSKVAEMHEGDYWS